ncbi:MAG: hypothetical protein QM811_29225 [Pirellulales bacterium]
MADLRKLSVAHDTLVTDGKPRTWSVTHLDATYAEGCGKLIAICTNLRHLRYSQSYVQADAARAIYGLKHLTTLTQHEDMLEDFGRHLDGGPSYETIDPTRFKLDPALSGYEALRDFPNYGLGTSLVDPFPWRRTDPTYVEPPPDPRGGGYF